MARSAPQWSHGRSLILVCLPLDGEGQPGMTSGRNCLLVVHVARLLGLQSVHATRGTPSQQIAVKECDASPAFVHTARRTSPFWRGR